MAGKKTRARDSKGHFIAQRYSKPRPASKAIARRAPATPAHRRRPAAAPPARRKRRGTGASAGGGGMVAQLKRMAPELIASAGYGYVTRAPGKDAKGDDTMALKIRETLDKVPVIEVIGKPATHGVLALFIATQTSGKARMIAALLAKAAFHRAAGNLGATGFDHEAAAHLAGDGDDGVELAGEMDD